MRRMVAIMSLVTVFGVATTGQQKSADSRSVATCTLKISGMFCSACAKTVEKAAKKVDGVKVAAASQPKGLAEVTYDPAKTSPDAIAKAITKRTGFIAQVEIAK